jgi:outer membrane protein assembly factor BamB
VPEVQITSPTPAEVFHATSITVEGTIDNEYLPADCKFTISVMRDQDGVEVFSKTYENRVRPFEYSDPVPAGFSEENISIEASKAKLVSGTYTISVTVENPAGIISNTAEVNIALSLEPPIITDERPTGALADTTPTIQARIYSPEDVDIDLASVQIVLDGSTVTHSVEPETGGPDIAISYTPTLDLTKDNPSTPENEGLHTVIINVLDVSGLQAEQKEWGFSIRDAPWPMFHCDTKHTGRSPYRGTQTSSLKWRCQTGSYVYSSPAISPDGTVYILSEDSYVGYLYAINPDGTPKWCYQTGYGVYSSPAIASDGTIYVGVYDYLYAINPDGTLKWCYQTGGNVTSPTIASDGTVYVGSDEYLYAINSDGTLKCRSEVGNMTISETSSPAISPDGTVYILSEDSYVGYLYAINPDGTFKWRCYVGDSYYSSPAIASDGTIYVSSWDRIISVHFCGYLYAINPDGTLKWIYKSDRWSSCFDSSPAISSDGTIYVGSEDNCLYAINPDGTLKWRYQTGGDVDSSPAIASDGTIYVGSDDDYIYAINPDGTLKWRYQTEFDIKSSPAISFDGTLYIVSRDDGYLYAIGE